MWNPSEISPGIPSESTLEIPSGIYPDIFQKLLLKFIKIFSWDCFQDFFREFVWDHLGIPSEILGGILQERFSAIFFLGIIAAIPLKICSGILPEILGQSLGILIGIPPVIYPGISPGITPENPSGGPPEVFFQYFYEDFIWNLFQNFLKIPPRFLPEFFRKFHQGFLQVHFSGFRTWSLIEFHSESL